MSTDVLRIKLADAIEASRSSQDHWMSSSPLTKLEIASRIVGSVENHLANSTRPFRSSSSSLRDDLRGLTLAECNFILDSFELLQFEQVKDSLFFTAATEAAIAAHKTEVVAKHGLFGKIAVSLLQLIDSE